MDDLAYGYYVLDTWSQAGGAARADVRSYFKARYGDASIVSLGKQARGIHFDTLRDTISDQLADGALPDKPSMADLNQALVDAGGAPATFSEIVSGGVAKSVDDVSAVATAGAGVLKWLGIGAAVIGAAYLVWVYRAKK